MCTWHSTASEMVDTPYLRDVHISMHCAASACMQVACHWAASALPVGKQSAVSTLVISLAPSQPNVGMALSL